MPEDSANDVGGNGLTPPSTTNVARYDKDYLIESGLFNFVERNILQIVLKESTQYSVDEAKGAINTFERDDN